MGYFFFFYCIPSYTSGVYQFWWDFCICDHFLIEPHGQSHSISVDLWGTTVACSKFILDMITVLMIMMTRKFKFHKLLLFTMYLAKTLMSCTHYSQTQAQNPSFKSTHLKQVIWWCMTTTQVKLIITVGSWHETDINQSLMYICLSVCHHQFVWLGLLLCMLIRYIRVLWVFFLCSVGSFSMIIWTSTVLRVLFACVLYFCIWTCSARLSTFHMERPSRNTLIIIVLLLLLFNHWYTASFYHSLCKCGKIDNCLTHHTQKSADLYL